MHPFCRNFSFQLPLLFTYASSNLCYWLGVFNGNTILSEATLHSPAIQLRRRQNPGKASNLKETMNLHISIIEEGDLKQTWVRVSALLEHVQYAVACIFINGVFTVETTVQK